MRKTEELERPGSTVLPQARPEHREGKVGDEENGDVDLPPEPRNLHQPQKFNQTLPYATTF